MTRCKSCGKSMFQGAPVLIERDHAWFCRACNFVEPRECDPTPAARPPMTPHECLTALVSWWTGGHGYTRKLELPPSAQGVIRVSWVEGDLFKSHTEEHTFSDGMYWGAAALAAVSFLRERGMLP